MRPEIWQDNLPVAYHLVFSGPLFAGILAFLISCCIAEVKTANRLTQMQVLICIVMVARLYCVPFRCDSILASTRFFGTFSRIFGRFVFGTIYTNLAR